MNDDATYDVQYNDGDSECGVIAEYIRPVAPAGGFAVGSHIEARYRGKKKWYEGTIAKVHSFATYDVQYNDGDSECGVIAECILAAATPGGFAVGSKIWARYYGKTKWYSGTIA